MKKHLIPLLLAALALSGCGSSAAAEKAAYAVTSVPALDELLPEQAAPAPEKPASTAPVQEGSKLYQFDRFTIELPVAWTPKQEGSTEYYFDEANGTAFMFNSFQEDNGLSADVLIERHLEALEGKSPEEIALPSDQITDENGNVLTLAQISYSEGGAASVLQLVFCRGQNVFLSFKGTSLDPENRQLLLDELDAAARTVTLEKLTESISGRSYNVEAENCRIDLKADRTFKITYDRNDNGTVTGTYRIYRGNGALDVLQQEEGIDPAPKLSYIRGSKLPIQNYYAVIFTYEEVKRWGSKANSKAYNVVVDGYDRDGKLEMYNHTTYISQVWEPIEE